MDCCNYVQPYPAHGHFYQQQHHFCYDNMNAYGAGAYGGGTGGGAPVSDSIEANAARYNRLPPAYPTDYVYNPKEARLRKAMREQSRELSRQSILQTAIASATGNTSGVGNGPQSGTGTSNFLNHPLNCSPSAAAAASVAAAAVSSLPGSPSFNSGNRIINPWFPAGHSPTANHLKPILSPRVMTVAQHQQQQQQQQQQRTFDKTKEVLRKQAECAAAGGAFSAASTAGYPSEFSGLGNSSNVSGPGRSSSAHESNDYCVIAEFSEGQKWHPYQNGPAAYHSRGGGPLTKMGALHPGMSSGNPHAHGAWNQFCGMPLSTPTMSRAPRHMVFLQEQQQNQHCGFPDEMQIPYMQNKHMEISHRLIPSYSQQEHQAKLQSSSMSPLNMSQMQEPEKGIEDGPRWESAGAAGNSGNDGSVVAMVSARSRRDSELQMHQEQQEQEHEQSINRDSRQQQHQQQTSSQQHRDRDQQQHFSDSSNSNEAKHKKTACSKQPLPGFHQAFGSTEIGRFSRSEFFANMVGESGNLIPEGFLPASMFPFTPNSPLGLCPTNPVAMSHHGLPPGEEELLQQMLPEDCFWLAPVSGRPPPISNLADSASNYAAFLDYSHRFSQQDWLFPVTSIPQDFQAALMDQPGAAFLFHENNCTLLNARHDRANYSESSCSSSSAGSGKYSRDRPRELQSPEESSTLSASEAGEPENLSARKETKSPDDSLLVEKSANFKESEDETDRSNA